MEKQTVRTFYKHKQDGGIEVVHTTPVVNRRTGVRKSKGNTRCPDVISLLPNKPLSADNYKNAIEKYGIPHKILLS